MDLYSGYINQLIEQFAKLPGVGNKSAQRLALHIINMPPEHVERFAQVMVDARKNIHYCQCCYTLTDKEICPICANEKRDHKTIMVVENVRDLHKLGIFLYRLKYNSSGSNVYFSLHLP